MIERIYLIRPLVVGATQHPPIHTLRNLNDNIGTPRGLRWRRAHGIMPRRPAQKPWLILGISF